MGYLNTCVRYEICKNKIRRSRRTTMRRTEEETSKKQKRRKGIWNFLRDKIANVENPTGWGMVYSTVDSHPSFVKGDRINNARNSGIVNKFLFGPPPLPDLLVLRPPSPSPLIIPVVPCPRLIRTTDGLDSRTFSTIKPTLWN